MKKITLIALMLFTALGYAQVGINTNNPDASSALEIESTTGGILIPRLTETQRDAISAPAIGLMIYQTNGTSGFYFYDGNIWTKIDGVAGPQGPAGLDGTNGTNGTDGADGTDGTDGVDGAPGLPGADGTDGVDGAPGLPGPSGADGTDGVDGLPGAPGLTGAAGTNGTNGTDGAQGLQGLKGDDGDQGEAGPAGSAGPQGPVGPIGPQGPAGPTGPTGPTGPQGPAGPDGDCGLDGNSSVWKLGNAGSATTFPGSFDLNGPITTFGAVSQININVVDSFAVNMQTWLGDAQIGDHVTIRERCVSGNYGIYELTSISGIPGNSQSWGLTFLSGTNTLSLTFATEYIIGYTQIGPAGPTGPQGDAGADGASYTQPTYLNNTFYAELGGYVIEVNSDGTHGLVVAMQDQGTSNWYEANDLLSNASNHDTNGAKFKDWRLPTKRELNLMYGVFISGNAANFDSYYYWSSTEYGSSLAWRQYFYSGGQDINNKVYTDIVRAVRAF